jgi:hypothetical protein
VRQGGMGIWSLFTTEVSYMSVSTTVIYQANNVKLWVSIFHSPNTESLYSYHFLQFILFLYFCVFIQWKLIR